MKIIHISPMYFSEESYIGGGERYPFELAKAISKNNSHKVTLISFGKNKKIFNDDFLHVKIYQPLWHSKDWANSISLSIFRDIRNSDIIHVHQYRTLITNIAISMGFILNKKVFVTDHGGGGFNFSFLPLHRLVTKFLCQTKFNKKLRFINKCPEKVEIIYGGVDEKKFKPLDLPKEKKILFVGRILPHKGINYLIEAIDGKTKLIIVGKKYDQKYFRLLRKMAKNKNVIFKTNLSDIELVKEYNTALVTVLPSVYQTIYGRYSKAPELLGLTLLESMACATPVICTNVGGMPHIVENEKTGFVVSPNNSKALSEKTSFFLQNPKKSKEMGLKARKLIENKFTWGKIAQKCLQTYKQEKTS